MNAAGSKINLNAPFGLQIFRIELHFLVLLLPSRLNKERIAQIVIVQMKRRLIVPFSIGRHGLTVGDPCILDQNVNIGAALTIRPAHKPFNRKPMVSLVRGTEDGWKKQEEGQACGDGNRLL